METLRESLPPYAIVIEGETLVRMDAMDILEDTGFRVLEAATEDGAIALLRRHGPETTLAVHGCEIAGSARRIRSGPTDGFEPPAHRIVVASGHAQPDPRDMPEVACFIDKPFSAGIVRDDLRRILPDDQKPAPLRA